MSDSENLPGAEINIVAPTPVWKHVLWAAVALGFLWAAAQIPNTLIVFSMAWLISYLLNPAIDKIQGQKLGPVKAVSYTHLTLPTTPYV